MSTVLSLLLVPLLPPPPALLLELLLLPHATIPNTAPASKQPVTALPRFRILLLWLFFSRGSQRPTLRSLVRAPDRNKAHPAVTTIA